MPKVGMRMVKSALAVFLCFVVHLFRHNEGIVFYSCIAAVLCVQQDVQNTKKVAFNRIVGTFIGGVMGMFVLQMEQSISLLRYELLQYILISLMIIVIIYITLLLHKPTASYISCVVFMSVCVSHARDVSPYYFAINRMVDTLIGILMAYIVNGVRFSRKGNRNLLFVVDVDALLKNKECFSSYSLITLRQLFERKCNIMLYSRYSPAVFLDMVDEVGFAMPCVVMDGASFFDIKNKTYHECCFISEECVSQINQLLCCEQMNCFVYTVIYQKMYVYFDELKHEKEKQEYEQMRCSSLVNYVYGVPEETNVLCMKVIDRCEKIQDVVEKIKQAQLDVVMNFVVLNETEMELFIYRGDVNLTKKVASLIGQEKEVIWLEEEDDRKLVKQMSKKFYT